jgi:hypothetical protein
MKFGGSIDGGGINSALQCNNGYINVTNVTGRPITVTNLLPTDPGDNATNGYIQIWNSGAAAGRVAHVGWDGKFYTKGVPVFMTSDMTAFKAKLHEAVHCSTDYTTLKAAMLAALE